MPDSEYIFVHIPKTAGRSVFSALGRQYYLPHQRICDYCDELGEDEVRRRFVFSTVRNPWERAVSWWLFFGNMASANLNSFSDWGIKLLTQDKGDQWTGFPRYPFDQMSFCKNNRGEIMVNTFMRFERIADDFISVASRLGISTMLPKIGSEEKRLLPEEVQPMVQDYRNAYTTQESIDAIAELESDLIDKFGYTFSN